MILDNYSETKIHRVGKFPETNLTKNKEANQSKQFWTLIAKANDIVKSTFRQKSETRAVLILNENQNQTRRRRCK